MGQRDGQIDKRIMGDPINAIVFAQRGTKRMYLVGGYLRDLLRGVDPRDRDFIVEGEILPLVKTVQTVLGGTIVIFGESTTVRLALVNGQTIDFSQLRTALDEDLSQRDFTINSLAWSPETGLIDPFHGAQDIEKKVVRCLSWANLVADPLRMLRAYRCAAEIGGTIEGTTRDVINAHRALILSVSCERITLELFYLLNAHPSYPSLRLSCEDGILVDIISLSSGRLARNVEQIHLLEECVLNVVPLEIKVQLHDIFSQNLTNKGLLCLELLSIGKRNVTRFPKLSLSRRLQKRLAAYAKGRRILADLKRDDREELFDFFVASGDAASDIILTTNRTDLFPELKKFQAIWRRGIVTSEEIMERMNIGSGRDLGKFIILLKKAEFAGVVSSREGAFDYLRDLKAECLFGEKRRLIWGEEYD